MSPLSPHLLLPVLLVCGSFLPGPCSYAPDPAFDCSLGVPCPENFACVPADPRGDPDGRGFCRSADIACDSSSALCPVPGLARIGQCVDERLFSTSKTHCGGCFGRCRGEGRCEGGRCVDETTVGQCIQARGNLDCRSGERCDDDGRCVPGAGDVAAGRSCSGDNDCDSGLCVGGRCSRTCDFGCPRSFVCDDDGAPGGLCVPVEGGGC
jgi:hypothetical protein